MKKLFLSLCLFGILGVGVMANDSERLESENVKMVSLSGRVMDMASGEVLSGVKIVVEEVDIHTYSDLDGYFTFESLMPGTYQISAAFISYERLVEKVDANDSAEVKMSLEQIKK